MPAIYSFLIYWMPLWRVVEEHRLINISLFIFNTTLISAMNKFPS